VRIYMALLLEQIMVHFVPGSTSQEQRVLGLGMVHVPPASIKFHTGVSDCVCAVVDSVARQGDLLHLAGAGLPDQR
jgi:hypothetical protein